MLVSLLGYALTVSAAAIMTYYGLLLVANLVAPYVGLTQPQLVRFANFVGTLPVPITFLTLVWLAAYQRSRRNGWILRKSSGLLLGILAAATLQLLIHALLPPVEALEAAKYSLLGAGGGWLGGWRALSDGRFYLASDDIRTATSQQAVTDIIAARIFEPHHDGLAILCEVPPALGNYARDGAAASQPSPATDLSLRVSCVSYSAAPKHVVELPRFLFLKESQERLLGGRHAIVNTAALESDNGPPLPADYKLALALPLTDHEHRLIAILLITERNSRSMRKLHTRQHKVLALPTSLALSNLSQAAQAKAAGRAAGIAQERTRIQMELHRKDSQTVQLTAIQIEKALHALDDDTSLASTSSIRLSLERAHHLADQAVRDSRRTLASLETRNAPNQQLNYQLQDLAAERLDGSGIRYDHRVEGDPTTTPQRVVEETLLAVAEEAITNALKHAQATTITLTLTYGTDEIRLDVVDDGTGFDVDATANGYGLRHMRSRVASVGGRVSVDSDPGEGTTIGVMLPLDYGGMWAHG